MATNDDLIVSSDVSELLRRLGPSVVPYQMLQGIDGPVFYFHRDEVEQAIQRTSSLAAANTTITAQALVLSQYREALIQPTLTRLDDLMLPTCLACGRIGEHRDEIIHEQSCVLFRSLTAAVEQAAAVLKAGEAMMRGQISRSSPPGTLAWQSRCANCMTVWWDSESERHTPTCVVADYRRAVAALRGAGEAS